MPDQSQSCRRLAVAIAGAAPNLRSRVMSGTRFDWRRFWCPPEGSWALDGDGFLSDPDDASPYHPSQPDVIAFEQVADVGFIAMLGELGSGKSDGLRVACAASRADPRTSHIAELVDLRSVDSSTRLRRILFEQSWYQRWLTDDSVLELFLDSADEALLRLDNLFEILVYEFEELPPSVRARLRVRIACRTADWSEQFGERMKALWDRSFRGVEIAPLRRKDVEVALAHRGLHEGAFFNELRRVAGGVWAARPLTLLMLLDVFEREGSLPSDRDALYHKGCRALCDEHQDTARRRRRSVADVGKRLALAERIAALLILCGREAVWTGPSHSLAPAGDLTIDEIAHNQGASDHGFPDTEIWDALDSGLFSSRGPHRFGLSHHAFGEYLAAEHLRRHEVAGSRAVGLLVDDPKLGGIIPQLREVAAWVASRDVDAFDGLAACDPQALIESDLIVVDHRQRKAILDGLLSAAARGNTHSHWRRDYAALAHPDLAAQLRGWLEETANTADPSDIVEIALLVAHDCEVRELEHPVVDIALDESRPLSIRRLAARAAGQFASEAERKRMLPLATEYIHDDVEDELKGYALKACWPELMDAQTLFDSLTPRRRRSLFGAYSAFLRRHLVVGLSRDQLAPALRWVHTSDGRGSSFESVSDQIITRAATQLDDTDIRDLLVDILHRSLDTRHEVLSDYSTTEERAAMQEASVRRPLVEALIGRGGFHRFSLSMSRRPTLVEHGDLLWAAKHAQSSRGEIRERWLALIDELFHPDDPVSAPALLEAVDKYPAVRERFSDWIEPVRLGSERDVAQREFFARARRHARVPKPRHKGPSPRAIVRQWLDRFEAGEIDAFYRLQPALEAESASRTATPGEMDLCDLLGWEDASTRTKRRLVDAAAIYVAQSVPPAEEAEHDLTWTMIAGYRALSGLRELRPEVLDSLPSATWQRWVPAIVRGPSRMVAGPETARDLMTRAHAHAPRVLVDEVVASIRNELKRSGDIQLFDRTDGIWDVEWERALLALLDEDLDARPLGRVVAHLVAHGSSEGRVVARHLIARLATQPQPGRERAAHIGAALLRHGGREGWPAIWAAMQSCPPYAEDLVAQLAGRHYDPVTAQIEPDELADLFIWLEERYPTAEDRPPPDEVYTPTLRDEIAEWRNRVLAELAARTDDRAVAALARVQRHLPELPWLHRTRTRQQLERRRETWSRSTPRELALLLEDPRRQMVRTPRELRAGVEAALMAIQHRLYDDASAVERLWNERGDGSWEPKSEELLSNFLAGEIRRELHGIAATDREVQVTKRKPGPGTGPRVDLLIQIVTERGATGLWIEVKPN